MRLSEIVTATSRFEYPVECQRVLAELGDVRIDCYHGDPETVADAMERCVADSTTFDTSRELIETLYTGVDKGQIGRENYDGRGDPHTATSGSDIAL